MNIVLVSLARRGGMLHFMAELAGGIAPLANLTAVIAAEAEVGYLNPKVARVVVRTGASRVASALRLLFPATWIGLGRKLSALGPDVVHVTGVNEWHPLVIALCWMMGIPVVYTVHDPEPHPQEPWTITVGNWISTCLANRLVTLTKAGRAQILARGVHLARVGVVPHPMYTIFRHGRRVTRRSERVILCFGRLEAYKGLEVLIRAFDLIQPTLPGWKLIIAGDGRLPDPLAHGAPVGIEVFHRYLKGEEVADLVSRCSIMVLPYTSATQSGIVALAQAFRKPVVASGVGGLKETIVAGKTGLFVRPGDPHALGRALRALALDPARRARMQKEIRRISELRWSPRVVAQAYMGEYVLAANSSRSV